MRPSKLYSSLLCSALLVLAGFGSLFAQTGTLNQGLECIFSQPFDLSNPTDTQVVVGIYGGYTAASNGLDQDYLNTLIFGGFIDQGMKSRVFNRLGDGQNRVGVGLQSGLRVRVPLGDDPSKQWCVLGRVGYRFMQDVGFSKDVFEFLFFGNAPLAGRTASLDGLDVHYLVHNHYDLGFAYEQDIESGGQFRAGLGLGFVQGLAQAQAEIDGSLFTASAGEQLDLTAAGYVIASDELTPKLGELSGAGWQFSARAGLTLPMGEREIHIDLSGEDIGRVNWKTPGKRYAVDSLWEFAGFTVDELNDLANGSITGNTDSLLDYLGLDATEGAYNSNMPGLIRAQVSLDDLGGWMLSLGGHYRMEVSTAPLIYARGDRFWEKPGIGIGVLAAYGDWGGIQIGTELIWQPVDAFVLKTGSSNLLTWLVPNSFTGGFSTFSAAVRW
jgi:hypothetical protein